MLHTGHRRLRVCRHSHDLHKDVAHGHAVRDGVVRKLADDFFKRGHLIVVRVWAVHGGHGHARLVEGDDERFLESDVDVVFRVAAVPAVRAYKCKHAQTQTHTEGERLKD